MADLAWRWRGQQTSGRWRKGRALVSHRVQRRGGNPTGHDLRALEGTGAVEAPGADAEVKIGPSYRVMTTKTNEYYREPHR